MPATRLFAIALALVSGTAIADAQTVISREVSDEPVETLITRGPDGITVVRRPVQSMAPPVLSTTPVYPTYWGGPAWSSGYTTVPAPVAGYATVPAPATGTIAVRTYAPPAPTTTAVTTTTTTVVDEDLDRPARRAVRTARRGTPPIMARGEEPEPVRTTRTRTVRRVTTTTPVERQVVYRTMVQEQTYDPATLPTVGPSWGTVGYTGYGYSWR